MTQASRETKPFTIVVGIDYSDLGSGALDYAIDIAGRHQPTQIHVVHVIGRVTVLPVGAVTAPDLSEESLRLQAHVEELLARHADRFSSGAPFDRLMTHIGLYHPAEVISQLAADVEADLVIVGTHGRRGAGHFFLGSVAEATIRLAPCPVLVFRPAGSVAGIKTPKIEPPCPRCLETRRVTNGKEFWCEQHAEHHQRPHTYHFNPQRSGHQSGFLIPFK